MNDDIKQVVADALRLAMSGVPVKSANHNKTTKGMLTRIGEMAAAPDKVLGFAFFAVIDEGDRAVSTRIVVDGPMSLLDTLVEVGSMEMQMESLRRTEGPEAADKLAAMIVASVVRKRTEEEMVSEDTCQCQNCQARRAMVSRGLAMDLGGGVLLIKEGLTAEQAEEEAQKKPH